MNCSRDKPISDYLNPLEIHLYSIIVDGISTEGIARLEEDRFVNAKEQLVLLRQLMYRVEMLLMFFGIVQEDEDAVDVHPHKKPQAVSKYIIDHTLE